MPRDGRAQRVRVLGVPLDPFTMDETVARVVEHVQSRQPGCHMSVNAATLVRALDDPEYFHWLEEADIAGADGQSVVWAASLLASRGPERVTGIDLMQRLLEEARRRTWSIYLLGARESVVRRLAERLHRTGVRVVGYRHGYFTEHEAGAIAADIARRAPDILFVGIPTPAKERFLIENARPAGIPFSVGVGGAFDVLAGLIRRAPLWMRSNGLEWLFRLAQEPRRLWHRNATTSTRFVVLVARELIRRRVARSRLRTPGPPDDGQSR
jgi:N-acetylglucosaminyldiphosphoundecaprenol N-acetyl-beta-D-mannosaminyltransferase